MKDRELKDIDTFIIHGSFTKASQNVTAKMIGDWHEKRGILRPMGYHYYIKRNGAVIKGRELERIGAHAEPWNTNSIGICLEGGMREDFNGDWQDQSNWIDNYTQIQIAKVWDIIRKDIVKIYEEEKYIKIIGHRDVPGVQKHCPGFDVSEKFEDLIRIINS